VKLLAFAFVIILTGSQLDHNLKTPLQIEQTMSNTVVLRWVLLHPCLYVSGHETRQILRNEIKALNYVEMSSQLNDIYYLQYLLSTVMI